MWKLDVSERLSHWRTFRKSLNNEDLPMALQQTASFWQTSPFSPYYLDPTDPVDWPDPWTLISENYYCDVARALGMLYTVVLTRHAPHTELRVYYDQRSKMNYNLVWIDDGKYILNMIDGEVVNKEQLPNTFVLKFQHDGAGLLK